MYVYIDESGNTGLNAFDINQLALSSVAILSKSSFDDVFVHQIGEVLNLLGVEELHSNELGLTRINSVAHKLRKLVKRARLRFVYAKIEKRYLALTKLFDTLFDSGENVAVPWHVYNVGLLRIVMLFKFSAIVEDDVLKTFWENCLNERSGRRAQEQFINVCKSIRDNVNALPDARSRQIVSEALQWAIDHHENITYFMRDEDHRLMSAANFVAFSTLLPEISRRADFSRRGVRKIIHDEQSQFASVFSFYHESMVGVGELKAPRFFGSGRLDFRPLANSELVMLNSKMSFGLQLADVYLYLNKKANGESPLRGDLAILYREMASRSVSRNLTFHDVEQRTVAEYRSMMNADISEEMFERGRALLRDIEDRRIQAMRAVENPQ